MIYDKIVKFIRYYTTMYDFMLYFQLLVKYFVEVTLGELFITMLQIHIALIERLLLLTFINISRAINHL